MASTDYTGRSVDLFIMEGAQPEGMRAITLSLLSDIGGQVTTGVQKASQFFLVALLTDKGSKIHDPEFGTRFVPTLRQAHVNDALLQITFRDAISDILAQQVRYQDADASDDEVLADIELLSFATPQPDELQLNVKLTTATGESRQVFVPISLAIK